jgi:putative ABC transport system permease protein
MFSNYFKIAWRNILKYRQFSLLNILGLSAGLACALLIFFWVTDEWKVDRFHKNDRRLYQVMVNSYLPGGIQTEDLTPAPLPKAMIAEMPEVEDATAIVFPNGEEGQRIVSVLDQSVKARELFVDRNFFNVFSFTLLQGNKKTALADKYNSVLSDELALKLFHSTRNIIGKTIRIYKGTDFRQVYGSFNVSGVFQKPTVYSSIQFDLLLSNQWMFDKGESGQWSSRVQCTYVTLKEGTNTAQFNNKISQYLRSKAVPGNGIGSEDDPGTLFLQHFSDRYLHNRYENGAPAGGRIQYVWLFSLIAGFILIIGCINFMNLSTARAVLRIKEAGIKKILGASRGTLIFQYLAESILMSIVSMMIGIILVILLLPAFNQLTGKQLGLQYSGNVILAILAFTLFTGIISGSYPAIYLSRFNPATSLKGKLTGSANEQWIRKGLVIFQFVLSVCFIIAVFVFYKQTSLIHTKNLGYNKDNIIQFGREGKLRQGMQEFLTEVKKIPGVVQASSMQGNMLNDHGNTSDLEWIGKGPGDKTSFAGLWVDYDLLETLGIDLVEGRSFSSRFGSDSSKMILNEAAIAVMELTDPIGKKIRLWNREYEIIGVVKNFHFASLYEEIKPAFFCYSSYNNHVLVKIKAGRESQTIAGLENLYKNYNLGLAFEYKFLDEEYQKLYASEQRLATLSRYFAALAIIISCLGLFGLAAFTIQKRQKEISIRKIVGATATNIFTLLCKDFLCLVFIALLIAFPLSWFVLNEWLRNFAYRINLSADIFFITASIMLFITLSVISFQAIKAAIVNPVASLKTE